MNNIFILVFLLICLQCGAEAGAHDAKWREGDSDAWASPDLDDADWAGFDNFQGAPEGIFWIRDHLFIDMPAHDAPANYALSCTGTGAFEIYFDGALLGYSGRVASESLKERPGPLKFAVTVPAQLLSPGEHLISLRSSATQLRSKSDFRILCNLQDNNEISGKVFLSLLLLGFAGAASAILCFYFLNALSSGRQSKSSLSALVAAVATTALTTAEAAFQTGLTTYADKFLSDLIAFASAFALYFALPATLLLRLDLLSKRRWLMGAGALLLFSIIPWPVASLDHDARAFLLLCAFCIALCIQAKHAMRRQARIFAIALAICIIGITVDPQNLYVFLVMLVLFLSASFVEFLHTQELHAKQAETTAARLEADLIRRNIQPHFLMNSLTVVSEWIETDPSSALKFIEGLATEFRLLASYSDQKLIALQDELALCRTHLELMGMRYRRRFEITTQGITGSEEVPPGLFHTLIENAFSHNRYTQDLTTFTLRKLDEQDGIRFEFKAPIGAKTRHATVSTGSGLRYVRSRLEESFSGRWSLSSFPKEGDWITDIRIATR